MNRSILVVGPSWVGDMVMAQALFMTIAAADPDAAIDVVAPPGPLALTARMPQVRAAFALPVPHGRLGLAERLSLSRKLGDTRYDRAIVLPSSFKAALVPALAGIPLRTGYRGEWRYGLINDMRSSRTFDREQNVRGYLELARERDMPPGPSQSAHPPVPSPTLTMDPANQARLITDLDLRPRKTVVALAPGAAYGPAKRWPLARYRELAHGLVRAGHDVWVLGGPEDREIGDAVAHGLARNDAGSSRRGEPGGNEREPGGSSAADATCHNLCGRTSLTDVVDLLDLAHVTVSNDSGLLHVAAAAGSHVVGLYGPTPPEFAPPLTDRSDIFYLGLECSPCFARECPLGHHRCLEDISVEDVQMTVTKVLARGPAGGSGDSGH